MEGVGSTIFSVDRSRKSLTDTFNCVHDNYPEPSLPGSESSGCFERHKSAILRSLRWTFLAIINCRHVTDTRGGGLSYPAQILT